MAVIGHVIIVLTFLRMRIERKQNCSAKKKVFHKKLLEVKQKKIVYSLQNKIFFN